MRRAAMVAVLVAALLVMTAEIALAASFRSIDGPNTIRDTNEANRIDGLAGDDNLFGRAGGDIIIGNRGDDFINVQVDGRVDRENCGSGRDVVRANPEDRLAGDCEVSKALAGSK